MSRASTQKQPQQQQQQQQRLAWSPFSCLPVAPLTISGLLQLDVNDQEVEVLIKGPCELRWEGAEYDGQSMVGDSCPSDAIGPWTCRQGNLTVTLTTHRLFFSLTLPNNNNNNNSTTTRVFARLIHLSNVHVVHSSGGPSLMHPNASYKLVLSTYTYGDLILSWGTGGTAHTHCEAVVKALETTLSRKAWEMATRYQQDQKAVQTLTARKVGVDHILAKHKLKHQKAAQVAQDALSGDAEQLLQQASALLQVIQSYTTLLNNCSQQQENDDNNNDSSDVGRLSALLQDMGMTSGLTKENFGRSASHGGGEKSNKSIRNRADDPHAAYYEWLARQVVDFLMPRLPSMGGVISLTDVYCLFNRARGTNLISPEDLRKACDLLSSSVTSTSDDDDAAGNQNGNHNNGLLRLPISQKVFSTGIVVLQLDASIPSHDQLVRLCPTTALEASHVLKLSPLLAYEQFQDAEQAGWLCRDSTLETTVFYSNRFSDWT